MSLLVLGATGATGQLVVRQALAAGHSVRALVRSPERLADRGPQLEVRTGQATDRADVADALDGVDAVISTLGAMKGSVVTDAVEAIIESARVSGLKRVVVLESFAVMTERLTRPGKLLAGMAMGGLVKDQSAAEASLRASDLDWTVVHAVRLSDAPATDGATMLPSDAKLGLGRSISRADVAAFLLASAIDPAVRASTSRRAVAIG